MIQIGFQCKFFFWLKICTGRIRTVNRLIVFMDFMLCTMYVNTVVEPCKGKRVEGGKSSCAGWSTVKLVRVKTYIMEFTYKAGFG